MGVPQTQTKDLAISTTWFDRVIGWFSPRSLLQRKRARLWNAHLARKYEGADAGRRTKGWNTNNLSANAEIAIAQRRIRDRARDLVRNNPYAARGVQAITNNVVGRGILTNIKLDTRAEVSTKEKRINRIWKLWTQTPAVDYDEVSDFPSIQRLCMRAVVESGEVFVRRRPASRRKMVAPDGRKIDIPMTQLQILESDFLATDKNFSRLSNGNRLVQGIELDANTGKRVAYHFYKEHPGGNTLVPASRFTTTRIPASEILHLYRIDRPGQLRGMSWLADIMLRLRDFDLYEDAQLKRQQCAAMFTAFVHDLEGLDEIEEEAEETELGEKMEPGLIEMLPPGKDIKLSDPPGADNYKEYTSVVLRSIAAGLGISYEVMTGDLSDVNFSSARMGWLEMQRNIDTWRANIMINQFLRGVFSWFQQDMAVLGQNIDSARAIHTPPRREMIDPVKETQALKDAVRSGFKTISDAVSELGKDPDTHFTELAQDNQTLDDNNLILDTDPRKINKTGSKQKEGAESESENNGDEV